MNMRDNKQSRTYYSLAYNPVEDVAVLTTRAKDSEQAHYDLYTLPKKAASAEADSVDSTRYVGLVGMRL